MKLKRNSARELNCWPHWFNTPNRGEDGDRMVLRNVGILPHHHAASQPRRPRLEPSPPWKLQISLHYYSSKW